MEPLTIVVSFDVSEQVVTGGIPGWVASLVHGANAATLPRSNQASVRARRLAFPGARVTAGKKNRHGPSASRRWADVERFGWILMEV
jgi:hypothetical protein